MKKILMDVVLNFIAILWLIVPVILAYSINARSSPLLVTWMVPFYLVAINIWLSRQYNNIFFLWRIVHCILILVIGYVFTYIYISAYFINKDSIIDLWSEIILYYAFIISVSVVIICLLVYQIVVFTNSLLKKRMNRKTQDESRQYTIIQEDVSLR